MTERQKQQIRDTLEVDDFEHFERSMSRVQQLDDDLIYDLLNHLDVRFWTWISHYRMGINMAGMRFLYDRRDAVLASRYRDEMLRYFLGLPVEDRDYRFIYEVFQHTAYPVHLLQVISDPLLLEIALDVYEYSVKEVQSMLDSVDQSEPSDTVDEMSEILEQWLEAHS